MKSIRNTGAATCLIVVLLVAIWPNPVEAFLGIVVTSRQHYTIHPNSLLFEHRVDCGPGSSLNVVPLADLDRDGVLAPGEVSAFNQKLERAKLQTPHRRELRLDGEPRRFTVRSVSLQQVSAASPRSSPRYELVFFSVVHHLGLTPGEHVLAFSNESFDLDLKLLLPLFNIPQHVAEKAYHIVTADVTVVSPLTILSTSKGHIDKKVSRVARGIFLDRAHREAQVFFSMEAP